MIRYPLGVALALLGVLAAQDGQGPQPDVTIRATTRLVEVTVVAQKHGVPVRDLRREDFRVLDEGKPQQVSFFSANAPAPAAPAGEKSATSVPASAGSTKTFSNRGEALSGPGSATVILIDPFNTGWADQIRAKQAIIGFLRQIRPEDRIGIYAARWPGYLQILYELTQDSSELVKRLAAWNPDVAGNSANNGSLQGSDLMQGMSDLLHGYGGSSDEAELKVFAGFVQSHNPHNNYSDTIDRTEVSLKLFEAIANHVAAIPGRKNLIWVSTGFPVLPKMRDAMRDTMRLLSNANVALYAVDAPGLLTLQPDATARPPLTSAVGGGGTGGARVFNPQWAQRTARTNNRFLEMTQAPMLEMSALTGGRAFLNTNDIQGAIRTAAEEASITYTLGFYPASPRHDGKFHRIEVKIDGRLDVSIRYRKGYVDAPDPANDPQGRTAAIRDAAWSPLDATAIGISAEVVPASADRYDLRLRIDPRTLDLQREHDQFNGRVDVVLVQEDHEGGQYDQVLDTLALALKPDTYRRALADGLAYNHSLQLDPKANELRVIVRDAFSGNVGSLTIPFKAFRASGQ